MSAGLVIVQLRVVFMHTVFNTTLALTQNYKDKNITHTQTDTETQTQTHRQTHTHTQGVMLVTSLG